MEDNDFKYLEEKRKVGSKTHLFFKLLKPKKRPSEAQ